MKRKTKNKNKINKKKGLAENKQGETKKGISAQNRCNKSETFEGEKNKINDREEQKTSQKHKGKKWTRKQFEKEKKKTQKTHSKRSQEDLVKNTKKTIKHKPVLKNWNEEKHKET